MNKVFAVISGLAVSVVLAVPASANTDGTKGQCDTCEKTTGKPDNAVGTISQFAHFFNSDGLPGGLGAQHVSNFAPGQRKPEGDPAIGRDGIGNVARTDAFVGDNPNSHLAGQTTMDGIVSTDPGLPPGNNDNPNRNNPNAAFAIVP